jgi:hypothetical protein
MKQSDRGHAHLTRSLQMLAEIEAASETSPDVQSAVMARWDAEHNPRRRARARTRRAAGMAATVAAGIAIFGVLAWQRSSSKPDTAGTSTAGASVSGYTTVAVVGGPLLAGEAIRVVRMRVARSVLGELGIPSTASQGEQVQTVDIDVLVGEDGVARGVRVPISEL